MLDLTNQRFGHLVAIRPTEQRKNNFVVWECRCDCGNTVLIRSTGLTAGNYTSCGCLRQIKADKQLEERTKQLVGQRFGRLTIIGPTDNRYGNSIAWECKCDCGNTTYAALAILKKGFKKSCGCIKREKTASVMARLETEMVGQKFGRLTVIGVGESLKNGKRVLECRCDCGNITFATELELIQGYRKSCGCLQKERYEQLRKRYPEILPGQRYGKLTTLRKSEEHINDALTWECKCDCGNITLAKAYQLSRDLKKSCGCLKKKMASPTDTNIFDDMP